MTRKIRPDLQRPTTAPPVYSQDGKGYDAIVHEHYFIGACDWLVTEYDPRDDLAFGWACLGDPQNAELGYIPLAEMDAVRVPITVAVGNDMAAPLVLGDQRVERDEDWPQGLTITAAIELLGKRQGGGS